MSLPATWGIGEHPRSEPDIIDALPCRGCGKHTLSIREVCDGTGAPVFWFYCCRPCAAALNDDLECRRDQFARLTSEGLSPDLAGRVMTAWFLAE